LQRIAQAPYTCGPMFQPGLLPPSLAVVIAEGLHEVLTADALAAKLTSEPRLLRDLRDQAEYSRKSWQYADSSGARRTGEFVVVPSGTLNPLSESVLVCPSRRCRERSARMFARSIGVYADQSILPDIVTAILLNEKLSPQELALALSAEMAAVVELAPLIDAGIVKFGTPPHGFCSRCDKAMTKAFGSAFEDLMANGLGSMALSIGDFEGKPVVEIDLEDLADASLQLEPPADQFDAWRRSLPERGHGDVYAIIRDNEGFRDALMLLLQRALYPVGDALRAAERAGGALASASRIEARFIRAVERRESRADFSPDWEVVRSVQLPWVKDLSVAQVVQLKDEARHALPALRELLARRLTEDAPESAIRNILSELRAEALEVEAELGSWQRARGKRFHMGLGALGLSFVVYGLTVAKDVASTALGTYLTVLASSHGDAHKERLEGERLRARPGYVLVHAKELLGHAE
jgi:hypothetical protein